ncbi:HAMP domain-containing protein [Herbidospora sp. NEAU-GS84]|uniref:histidine kinase n=1 Tax=Herbidospora solisilvae TaxID=2696284 RepID=A0A7C9NFP9_9ACTN|nr:HAMP domain-containing sensor histidine kinase [Herbidospora solisilvae]NAS21818.1 HAMP domain-containing protein [Herbidospora solisilvae]
MSLRRRVTFVIAVAVAVAIAVCAGVSWLIVRDRLRDQVVESLEQFPVLDVQVAQALARCGQDHRDQPWDPSGRGWQLVRADGSICQEGSSALDPLPAELALTTAEGSPVVRDGVLRGKYRTPVIAYTEWFKPGTALTVFRSTREMDASLRTLGLVLAGVCAVGVLGACVTGLYLARTALRPVASLTGAVEHVARTEDLEVRIPVDGKDEIARLGAAFNTMTAALAASRDRQRQLVSDAGHELRTPLTSLRTNIDLLLRSENTGRPLAPEAKRLLLVSVKEQFEEMSSLIADLLELSRNAETGGSSADVELQDIVSAAVDRARRRGPGLVFDVELSPWRVRGDVRGLQRAAVNILDNAVKFSPEGGTVTVRLRDGELTVRDEGPGIADEELPHVFERFWRSPAARSLPGSGLGLAIVAQAVRAADGEVGLESGPSGGTTVTVRLPGSAT